MPAGTQNGQGNGPGGGEQVAELHLLVGRVGNPTVPRSEVDGGNAVGRTQTQVPAGRGCAFRW